MKRLNGWRPPRWFQIWMVCASRGGDGWLWYFTGGCLLISGGLQSLHSLASAGAAGGLGVTCFLALKRAFRRRRPCAIHAHCWSELLPPDQFSFPSGHSITAFAMAVCIGLFHPGLMPWLLFCAFSIALSRIVLGMHFLSDVVVGSAIGATLGYSAFILI